MTSNSQIKKADFKNPPFSYPLEKKTKSVIIKIKGVGYAPLKLNRLVTPLDEQLN